MRSFCREVVVKGKKGSVAGDEEENCSGGADVKMRWDDKRLSSKQFAMVTF